MENKALQKLRKRQKFANSDREALLDPFQQSHLFAADFAPQQGIGYSTLRAWMKRMGISSGEAPKYKNFPAPQFVEVSLSRLQSSAGPTGKPLGIRLPPGIELSLNDSSQVDWALHLITQLREGSC